MVRRILPVLLAAAIALAAWLALRAPEGAPAAAPIADGSGAATTPGGPVEPIPTEGAEAAREVAAGDSPTPSGPDPAVLAVRVLAREDGRPLAEVSFDVREAGDPDAFRASRQTGAEGRAEVEVPAGAKLVIAAWPDPGRHGGAQRALPALAAGSRAAVDLEVATRPDQPFFGRLVDAQSKAPVSAAVLHRLPIGMPQGRPHDGHERGPGATPVAADGRFRLDIGSWDHVLLCVHAPGWSLATVQLTGGHDAPERERTISLWRSGGLRVSVVDAAGLPLDQVRVRATFEGYALQQRDSTTPLYGADDPWWEATTGTDGRVELAGLPARVEVALEAWQGGKPLRARQLPALEPGEVRDVELRVGGGARVVGELVESGAGPLADVEVWLVPGAGRLYLGARDEPAASSRTDESGRFVFEDVAVGSWGAAAAPHGSAAPPSEQLSSVRTPFEVREGDVEVIVRVVVHRGLTLQGIVLDPQGEPVDGIGVLASSTEPWGTRLARTGESGRFELAGLAPGELELRARELGPARFAPGPRVRARAGSRDVVLRVVSAASIAGRLIVPDGTLPARGRLMLSRSDTPSPLEDLSLRGTTGSSFLVPGLEPGVWGLAVTTPDGLVGAIGGIALEAGMRRQDVVLRLEPGAELRVRVELEACTTVSAFADGACLAFEGVRRGESAVFRVPGGRVRLLAFSGNAIVGELEVDVLAGDVREIVLD